MKIDIKTRIKNPTYIMQIITSIILPIVIPVLAYYNLTFEDITNWTILLGVILDTLKNPYVLGMIILNILNATIDPRSKGIGDNLVSKEEFEYEDFTDDSEQL